MRKSKRKNPKVKKLKQKIIIKNKVKKTDMLRDQIKM